MTTNDDMTPRQPDEDELLGDAPDFVDETVARITDADVSEHLRRVLNQSGYTGQMPGQWPPQHRIDLSCPLDAVIVSEYREMANLAATVQANARLSRESLRQAKKLVAAARQEAEQIVSAAHDEADEALKQAAQMVRDAREQAAQIISAARREAEQIGNDARDSHASQMTPFQFLVSESGNTGGEVALLTELREAFSRAPVWRDLSFRSRHLGPDGQSAANGFPGADSNSLAELPQYPVEHLDEIGLPSARTMRAGPLMLLAHAGGTVAAIPAWLPADTDRLVGSGVLIGDAGGESTSVRILTSHYVAEAARRLKSPDVASPEIMGGRPAPPADGQICAIFAVDIAGFIRPERDEGTRLHLHKALYEMLGKAFDDSGIPWARCYREDRGDGALIVVPPDIACEGIIDPLPERLHDLIRRHNHVSSPAAGIRLRAAAHIGPVERDGHGFVGSDINLLFRMLEAKPLRRTLADSGAELALVVSEGVYRSLVCRSLGLASPDAFQPIRFQAKQVRSRAWTYLPGPRTTQAVPDTGADELVRPSRRRLRALLGLERGRRRDDDNPNECHADLARIKTLYPRTYSDARTIGEHFRAGTPVVMNLTGTTSSDAKRLVDFSAGLIFALHGSIERVTDKVFLLAPAIFEVTAEDKTQLTEHGTVKAGQRRGNFRVGQLPGFPPDAQAAIDHVDTVQADCSALGT